MFTGRKTHLYRSCQKSKRNCVSRTRRAIARKALGEFKMIEFFPRARDDTPVNVSPGRVRQRKGLSSRSEEIVITANARPSIERARVHREEELHTRRDRSRFLGTKFFRCIPRTESRTLSNSSCSKCRYIFSSIEIISYLI